MKKYYKLEISLSNGDTHTWYIKAKSKWKVRDIAKGYIETCPYECTYNIEEL